MCCEDDFLPLSALQHFVFCERQAALIHIEDAWADNPLTVEGQFLHEKVDAGGYEVRDNVRIAHGLLIRSLRLGLTGKTDVVEFHPDPNGVTILSLDGRWRAFPVEYKRGKPKPSRCDEIQLCAQALCLEEMLNVAIAEGAMFYHQTRRRWPVTFDFILRAETETIAARLHELVSSQITPKAVREKKCERCSLLQLCLPEAMSKQSASAYLEDAIRNA